MYIERYFKFQDYQDYHIISYALVTCLCSEQILGPPLVMFKYFFCGKSHNSCYDIFRSLAWFEEISGVLLIIRYCFISCSILCARGKTLPSPPLPAFSHSHLPPPLLPLPPLRSLSGRRKARAMFPLLGAARRENPRGWPPISPLYILTTRWRFPLLSPFAALALHLLVRFLPSCSPSSPSSLLW